LKNPTVKSQTSALSRSHFEILRLKKGIRSGSLPLKVTQPDRFNGHFPIHPELATVAYLECGKGGAGGRKSPSGVQGQSPGRGSAEADAYLLMNAQILTFWRNKLLKQSGLRHYTVQKKIMVRPRGGIAQCPPPKYATG